MGFKMRPKSPLMKKLVGKQHRLPEHLKAKIEAAPSEAPLKLRRDSDKKTEKKLNKIVKKINKQADKQFDNEDKGTKRGDKRANKAYNKGRKLIEKGRAIKKAANEKKSPVKKKEKTDIKEKSDKELLAKVEKEGIATDSGNKEKVAEVKKAYTRQVGRDVGSMSRKEARQEVKADRKEARVERKAYKKNVKRNKGGAFAGGNESKQAGKNIPGLLSSKKKKKSYLTAKGYKGFDKYLADNTKVKEAGKSALNKKGCKTKKY